LCNAISKFALCANYYKLPELLSDNGPHRWQVTVREFIRKVHESESQLSYFRHSEFRLILSEFLINGLETTGEGHMGGKKCLEGFATDSQFIGTCKIIWNVNL
jgi:hypothetical protein